MKDLFIVSIYRPFIRRPIYLVLYFVMAVLHIKKWHRFFNVFEEFTCQNRVRFFKTIYFNFRSLPYKQAKHMPIHVYGNTEIISSEGKIELSADNVVSGMIRWGWFHTYRSQGKARINNKGKIIFRGKGRIFAGSEIVVFEDGMLEIGKNFFIGENTMIYCSDEIIIGDSLCLTYNCQIFDSDFHYSINTMTGEVGRRTKPVHIGHYNWIGNNTTIKKGVATPNHLTVAASYSVLTKDYRESIPPYSVIGGAPARLIGCNVVRLWNNEYKRIEDINEWFRCNPSESSFRYDVENHDIKEFIEN